MSKILKLILASIMIGLLAGALSSAFLHALNYATALRESNPYLIFGLPLFAGLFSIVIKNIPHHVNQGIPYLLEELENPKAQVSPWMTPFIFISSLGTHLFGGSAGREGVGVVMGASAAHLLEGMQVHRRILIYAGAAAGFSSIFGTPLAAILFCFEVNRFKDIKRIDLVIYTAIASFAGLIIPNFAGPVHQHFEVTMKAQEIIPYILIAGLAAGLGANFFFWGLRAYTKLISRFIPHLGAKLTIGSLIICLLVYFTHGYEYVGIGTDLIEKSFVMEMSYYDFAMKALLTIMTISIGLKGGEVTPLFCMGATLSNWAGSLFNFQNFALSSSLGMVGIFGAVIGAPIASAIMGAELFGWKIGLVCFISCFIARLMMGKRSVYRH